MRNVNIAFVIVPPVILWFLLPVFEASTISVMAKDCVMGLLILISAFGLFRILGSINFSQSKRIKNIIRSE